ncbi:RluA family pseudouridine synthase [Alicyclobacillaceae bacterium I2511]|nr:RluA family pseudouridine synthase [Alicyclobacillaceae bacterium I2511]
MEFTIGSAESGKKLHRWLRQQLPGVPLSGIYKFIRTGRIKINGKKSKIDKILQEGDNVTLFMAEEDYTTVKKRSRTVGVKEAKIEVIYESEDLLVVNKPVGVLVHDTPTERSHTLVHQVRAYLDQTSSLNSEERFQPGPSNRLDRNTSGLVMFAKNNRTAQMLGEALKQHHLRKWYLALVQGEVPQFGVLTSALQRDQNGRKTRVVEGGKAAATSFIRRATVGDTSIVQVELISGRTHQIRAHFASIGNPLVGDMKYGGNGLHLTTHQWLHAGWLELPDGTIAHAPLSTEFQGFLRLVGYDLDKIESLTNLELPFADEW